MQVHDSHFVNFVKISPTGLWPKKGKVKAGVTVLIQVKRRRG